MDLLFVGIGGALGSIARFALGRMISQRSGSSYPVGTFAINITGALLLGIVSGLNVGQNLYWLFADGFLGAYTTFSTFMYEGFQLFNENEKKNAAVYILTTLILGVAGYFTGFELVKAISLF